MGGARNVYTPGSEKEIRRRAGEKKSSRFGGRLLHVCCFGNFPALSASYPEAREIIPGAVKGLNIPEVPVKLVV